MRKALKRHGRAEAIITDGLKSYPAAMRELGNEHRREIGRHANNRVENSHLPFRRRERAMQRFRQMKSLQKFASVHASLHNHFNQERHLADRQTYKLRRSAALAEWQMLAARCSAGEGEACPTESVSYQTDTSAIPSAKILIGKGEIAGPILRPCLAHVWVLLEVGSIRGLERAHAAQQSATPSMVMR